MLALPPALLFDLDDTILAFSAPVKGSWMQACEAYVQQREKTEATPRVELDAGRLFTTLHQAMTAFWADPARAESARVDMPGSRRTIVREVFEHLGLDDEDGALELAAHFSQLREAGIDLFPRARDTLVELRRRGHRLGLVTNGAASPQRRKIHRFALAPLFEAILVEGEWGVGKPDASIFRAALERLGTHPCDACMVGDNLAADIRGAADLGLLTIWNDFDRRGLPGDAPATPDRTIHSIAELLTAE